MSADYAVARFANNLGSKIYRGTERYNFPIIQPTERYEPVDWLGFDKAMTTRRTDVCIHFFMHDFVFERIWNNADRYIEMLSRFDAVVSPDFSMYRDWPVIVQMWNHYRKHYIAARLQDRGVTVYPKISWTTEASYDWCFDGEPRHCPVVVSTVGKMKNPETKRLFLQGYQEMLKRLEPTEVICYGKVPEECTGNIIRIKAFYEKFEHEKPEEDST